MLNKISFNGLGVGHPANPYDVYPNFMVEPKVEPKEIHRLKARPDDNLVQIMKDYYPKLKQESVSNPNAVKYTGTFDDFYKSSFTNPEIANSVFNASQAARRRNPQSRKIPANKFINMNTFFPLLDLFDLNYSRKAKVPNKLTILGYNKLLDFDKGEGPLDTKQFLKHKVKLAPNYDGFEDSQDATSAYFGRMLGPHNNPQEGRLIVPKDNNYKIPMPGLNVMSVNAHEIQHSNAYVPGTARLNSLQLDNPRTKRWFYAALPNERTRTYHGMKAIASDLARKPVNDYNEAISVLRKHGILTEKESTRAGNSVYNKYEKHKLPFTVDDERFYQLVREGKIQPTDPTMIDDVIDLNEKITNPATYQDTKNFMEQFKKHGIHPYTKQRLDEMLKDELDSNGKPLKDNPYEYNRRLWEMIRKIEFEEANNRTRTATFNPQYA